MGGLSALGGYGAPAVEGLDMESPTMQPQDLFGTRLPSGMPTGGGSPAGPGGPPQQEAQGGGDMMARLMEMVKKYGPAVYAGLQAIHGIQRANAGPDRGPGLPRQFTQSSGVPHASWNRTPAPAHSPESYYTYGARPQQSFYGGDSMPGGMAHGGQSHGMGPVQPGDPSQSNFVRGSGSGRDDTIPAHLSDSEYVLDAETVSMLGDGSADEGARRLDDMRKRIRMQKGKALAKGKFSPNAQAPEKYLRGKGKPLAFDVGGEG